MQKVHIGTVDANGNFRSLAGDVAPIGYARGLLSTVYQVHAIPLGTRRVKVSVSALAWVGVQALATAPAAPVGEVQTITAGDAAAGTFTATWQGYTATAQAFNIAAATFQTNLRALASMTGAVAVTGGPLNTTPLVVTFDPLIITGNVPLIVLDSSGLTGGVSPATRALTLVETTPGSTPLIGHLEANATEQWVVPGDAQQYLALRSDTGTGTWRATFYPS